MTNGYEMFDNLDGNGCGICFYVHTTLQLASISCSMSKSVFITAYLLEGNSLAQKDVFIGVLVLPRRTIVTRGN